MCFYLRSKEDDVTKIPNWNYDNIFSKSVGKVAENFSGKFVEGFLKETIFAPISIGAGEFVGRAVNQKTQEIHTNMIFGVIIYYLLLTYAPVVQHNLHTKSRLYFILRYGSHMQENQ